MRAKYTVWSVDEKLIKEAVDFALRYGDDVITENVPIDLNLKFLYQMLNLSDKHKSTSFLKYRSNNPEDFEETAYHPEERLQMLKILSIPKLYELAVGKKGEELLQCTFAVSDVRAVEQIERMISKANTIAVQSGQRNVAYSDYEVPGIRDSVYCTPLAKLRRNAYNWD